jgi:hypothetical protein
VLFRGEEHPDEQIITATFVGDGLIVGYPPGVTPPGWLSVATVGPIDASPISLRLAIVQQPSTAGNYSTTVRLVTGKLDGSAVVTRDLSVSFRVKEPFTVDRDWIGIHMDPGGSPDSRPLRISGTDIQWRITADEPWIELSATAGSGTTLTPSTVNVTAVADGAPPGLRVGSLLIEELNTARNATVEVRFGIAPNRWNVSRSAVPLIEYAGSSAASQRVHVTSDFPAVAEWAATSSTEWLQLTREGEWLTVAPGPSAQSLAADTLHLADVVVSGGDLDADVLRVGYYRSAMEVPGQRRVRIDFLGDTSRIIPDPLRPYAYVQVPSGQVYRAHLVTGELDTLFTDPDLRGAPAISGDGRYFYATTGRPGQVRILRYDLDADLRLPDFGAVVQGCCAAGREATVWTRQRGVPLLVNTQYKVFNAETGELSQQLATQPAHSGFHRIVPGANGKDVVVMPLARRVPLTGRPAVGDGILGPAGSTGGWPTGIDLQIYAGFPASPSFYGGTDLLRRFDPGELPRILRFDEPVRMRVANNGVLLIVYKGSGLTMYSTVYSIDPDGPQQVALPDEYSGITDVWPSPDSRFGLVLAGGRRITSGSGLEIIKLADRAD